jgi:hypothetical protein
MSEISPRAHRLAQQRARDIRKGLNTAFDLIKEAWKNEDWKILGYPNWQEYCKHEFDTSTLRIPAAIRREIVQNLLAVGMSTRGAAAATGLSQSTVAREAGAIATESPGSVGRPERVNGLDGRSQPATRPRRREDAAEQRHERAQRRDDPQHEHDWGPYVRHCRTCGKREQMLQVTPSEVSDFVMKHGGPPIREAKSA